MKDPLDNNLNTITIILQNSKLQLFFCEKSHITFNNNKV